MTARPNVVLIVADDMGYGDFGFVNGGLNATPALDRLAADGVVFGNHYAAAPVCAPARAAFLTGRYPQRTGVVDTLEARGGDRLARRETTIADEFAAAGYRTGLIGKWHCGTIGDEYSPIRRGFDEFVGFWGGWQDYWDWQLERNGEALHSDGRYLTHVITDEAVDFIRRSEGETEPFFLHVAYNAPHYPFQAPQATIERHLRPGRSQRVATIYAMIEEMDRGVAAIRRQLEIQGSSSRTIVLFTSDNGPELGGEGEESCDRFNAGLSGEKCLVLEGGIRVPLLIAWPGSLPAGARNDTFVHGTDLLPTLIDLAGLNRTGALPLDGRSIAPYLHEPDAEPPAPHFWQWSRYQPVGFANAAAREGAWKLVRPAVPGLLDVTAADAAADRDIKRHPESFAQVDGSPPPERNLTGAPEQLFDLGTDPGECRDVASAQPQVVQRLGAALDHWFAEVEADRSSLGKGDSDRATDDGCQSNAAT